MNKLELLAPAGSLDSVKAAIHAGADAVYMGGSKFGARAFAQSVTEDSVAEAIDYVHLHGKKLFLTVNTLLTQEELQNELVPWLLPYYEQGLDGVIVQDFGVLEVLKKEFPKLPLHASTQMMVTGPNGANSLKERGIVRVVAARELSLKEIKAIYDGTGMEIEAFVHGSVCYCYSGQCLFSSLVGGRSGNRGACAQPCRLPYQTKIKGKKSTDYVMSLKDMCTLQYLPQMIEAGVVSFKIEGRMKSPLYTAGVVSIYRKYLDLYLSGKDYHVDSKDMDKLLELFDRGGFSDHYLVGHNSPSMIAKQEKKEFRVVDEGLRKEIEKTYLLHEKKESIVGKAEIFVGKPAKLQVSWKDFQIEVYSSQLVDEAKNRPLLEEDIRKQLEKTGSSFYQWERLDVKVIGHPFLPVKQLNELRRQAFEALQEKVKESYKRETNLTKRNTPVKKQVDFGMSVSIENMDHLPVVLSYKDVDTIILYPEQLDFNRLSSMVEAIHKENKKCLLAMPVVFRTPAIKEFTHHLEKILQVDGLVVENLEEMGWLQKINCKLPILLDHRVYIWNQPSKDFLQIKNLLGYTVPVELSDKELEVMDCSDMELVVYGRMPMMVTANCIRSTLGNCVRNKSDSESHSMIWITDRKKQQFPVKNNCKYCYNIIYNSLPLSLSDRTKKVKKISPKSIRLAFTIENESEVKKVLETFIQAFKGEEVKKLETPFTRGNFGG
ncbi:Protease [Lachnospiraceae bacterium TWA4]|nr:Protease [Lachnospiraceae bacterium TWA4]